ncbi:MAG: hypothetical protein ACHQZR_02110 [Candidatus Limnocylindrales bacterium]
MCLRRLRQDRAAAVGYVLLTLVTAVVFATAPRLLTQVSQQGLQAELAAVPPTQRDVRVTQITRPETMAGLTIDGVMGEGQALEQQLPPALQATIGGTTYVVSTPLWHPTAGTPIESVISLRIQQDVEAHLRLVAGAWPSGATTRATDRHKGAPPGAMITTFPVAMAADAAAALQVGVGDTIALSPESTDPLADGRLLDAAVTVVGLYAPLDPADPYWHDDADVQGFTLRVQGTGFRAQEHPQVDTTVLLSPAAYPALGDGTENAELGTIEGILPLEYEWRYVVDPARVRATSLDGLVAALRRAGTLFPTTIPPTHLTAAGDPATAMQTGLLALVAGHLARWTVVRAVMLVAAIGAGTVALACLALVAVLASQRRRRSLLLARGRGASRAQIAGAIVFECLVLTVPPVVLAVLVARLLVPSTAPGHLTGLAAAGVGFVAAGTYALAVASSAFGPFRAGQTRDRPGRATPRRVVLEALVVLAAIGGVVLLRQRGILGGSSTLTAPTVDPLLAAAPALVGLAVGLLAVRLYPLPMRLAAGLAARRRDAVPVLALRRVTRGGGGAAILLILLASTASAVFASATLVHVDASADAVAWQQVGAPVQLSVPTGGLVPAADLRQLPGVTASADGFRAPVTTGTGSIRTLIALDTARYEAIVRGTPIDPSLPADMLAPVVLQPLPVIVSPSTVKESHQFQVGDVFPVTVAGARVDLRVVQIRPTFPSIPVGNGFVVISQPQLAALAPPNMPSRTFSFLQVAPSAIDGLTAAVVAMHAVVTVQVQAQVAASLRASPPVAAVATGVAITAAIALAYAALAVAAALALAGAGRAVEMAHLRVFGLTGRQGVELLVLEYGPALVVAFLGGAILGLGLFALLRDGLGLTTLIGSAVEVPLGLALVQVLLLLVTLVAIVTLGLGVGALLQRGAVPATAIREGIE